MILLGLETAGPPASLQNSSRTRTPRPPAKSISTMRRYSIALLVTGVLFAFAHSASATTTSKITAEKLPRDSRFFVIHHDDMPTRRLLRIDGAATDNNEERGYPGGLIHAGTSKVDDLLASAKLKEYEALVN
ncbi:hypothetical protein F444_14889, partial [Phytophthora nicotianae P1976]